MYSVEFVHGGAVHTVLCELLALLQGGIIAPLMGDDGVSNGETGDVLAFARLELAHLALHPVGKGVWQDGFPVSIQYQVSLGHPAHGVLPAEELNQSPHDAIQSHGELLLVSGQLVLFEDEGFPDEVVAVLIVLDVVLHRAQVPADGVFEMKGQDESQLGLGVLVLRP